MRKEGSYHQSGFEATLVNLMPNFLPIEALLQVDQGLIASTTIKYFRTYFSLSPQLNPLIFFSGLNNSMD